MNRGVARILWNDWNVNGMKLGDSEKRMRLNGSVELGMKLDVIRNAGDAASTWRILALFRNRALFVGHGRNGMMWKPILDGRNPEEDLGGDQIWMMV